MYKQKSKYTSFKYCKWFKYCYKTIKSNKKTNIWLTEDNFKKELKKELPKQIGNYMAGKFLKIKRIE